MPKRSCEFVKANSYNARAVCKPCMMSPQFPTVTTNVFSFMQWNKYFHSVKDEMFHSTWLHLVEWNISSFTSWKYLYHCTHKHSLFVYSLIWNWKMMLSTSQVKSKYNIQSKMPESKTILNFIIEGFNFEISIIEISVNVLCCKNPGHLKFMNNL